MTRSVDLRLAGQYHELTVALPDDANFEEAAELVAAMQASFESAYAERYGRMLHGLAIEATNWRLEGRGPDGRVRLTPMEPGSPDAAPALKGHRPVYFNVPDPGFVETPVYDRSRLTAGMELTGPAVVEEPAATIILHPGDQAVINPYGAIVVQRGGRS